MSVESWVKDLLLAVLIVLGVVGAIYLLFIGIHVLLIIGLLIPGWLVLLLFLFPILRKRKK